MSAAVDRAVEVRTYRPGYPTERHPCEVTARDVETGLAATAKDRDEARARRRALDALGSKLVATLFRKTLALLLLLLAVPGCGLVRGEVPEAVRVSAERNAEAAARIRNRVLPMVLGGEAGVLEELRGAGLITEADVVEIANTVKSEPLRPEERSAWALLLINHAKNARSLKRWAKGETGETAGETGETP